MNDDKTDMLNSNLKISDTDVEPVTASNYSHLLIKVADDQDKEAFSEIFLHFAPRVKSYMMKLGSDEQIAEELAQQVLLKVWRKAKSFDPEKAAASTWIFRIARNLRIDALRKQKHFYVDDYDMTGLVDEAEEPSLHLDREKTANTVGQAISELSEDQATVIRLSFFDGLSHGDIAEQLELPLGTVKSRIRLAFSRLRGTLKPHAGEML